MRRMFLCVMAATALFLASCAKVVVVPVPATGNDRISAEGVFYALPKTFIRVQVNVDHSAFQAGTYLQYAELFVPGEKLVCETSDCAAKNKKAYSLQNNAAFTPMGEPDPANVYMVKFVGRGAVDQNIAMTWTETGLLSTASASATNRTSDVIVSGLKLAAGIGAKAAFAASAKTNANQEPECKKPTENDAWIIQAIKGADISLAAARVLIGNYCALAPEVRRMDRYVQSKSEEDFHNALDAYVKNVYPLISARTNILNGSQGLMEPTELLTKIETLLDQQIKTLFLGNKDTKTWAGSIEIHDPPSPGTSGVAVMHVNGEKGICIGDGSGGTAIAISVDAKPFPDGFGKLLTGADCTNASAVNLTTVLSPGSQLFQSVRDHTTRPSGELSFRYRIPAQVRAELKQGDDSYGMGVFSVAQFGVVATLPANRHSKSLSYDLAMVEATGGLKSFKIATTGSVDSGTVDALAGISGTLLDASNAAAKADKTAKDELTTLTRQDTLLKLKDDICTLQKKYGLDCTIHP
jgi:hypothetical protein